MENTLIAKGENINGQDVVIVEPTGKTIREWLNELPDGYREQALENHEKYYKEDDAPKVWNIKDALYYGFDWYETIQGGEYWLNIYEAYGYAKTPLPALSQPEPDLPEPTQLDRIEAKLTEILALLKPKSIDPSLHTID